MHDGNVARLLTPATQGLGLLAVAPCQPEARFLWPGTPHLRFQIFLHISCASSYFGYFATSTFYGSEERRPHSLHCWSHLPSLSCPPSFLTLHVVKEALPSFSAPSGGNRTVWREAFKMVAAYMSSGLARRWDATMGFAQLSCGPALVGCDVLQGHELQRNRGIAQQKPTIPFSPRMCTLGCLSFKTPYQIKGKTPPNRNLIRGSPFDPTCLTSLQFVNVAVFVASGQICFLCPCTRYLRILAAAPPHLPLPHTLPFLIQHHVDRPFWLFAGHGALPSPQTLGLILRTSPHHTRLGFVHK